MNGDYLKKNRNLGSRRCASKPVIIEESQSVTSGLQYFYVPQADLAK
jgi:hypothetical protein